MKRCSSYFDAWLAVILFAGTSWADSIPSLNAEYLAKGKYSSMHMLLEKTVLKVDVLSLDVRVGKKAQSKFTEIAKGKSYSADLVERLADVAINADHAVIQLTFKRNMALKKWIGLVRANLRMARETGLITAAAEKKISDGLPQWFVALKSRGFVASDRLLYGVEPENLTTAVVDNHGNILVYRCDKGKEVRGVIMASYFVPGSEFREPLLRSLVGQQTKTRLIRRITNERCILPSQDCHGGIRLCGFPPSPMPMSQICKTSINAMGQKHVHKFLEPIDVNGRGFLLLNYRKKAPKG